MGRHNKPGTTAVALRRSAVVGAAAATGLVLLTSPAGASDNDTPGSCPEGSQTTCRINNYEVPPAVQVGDLVSAQVKLLHCPGQIADIKAKVLRQLDVDGSKDWAVKARVLVGQYCHKPPVIIVPVPEPAPEPAPAPELAPAAGDLPSAPIPTPVSSADTPVPTVTH